MTLKVNLLILVCCLASVSYSDGCTMEGVSVWQLPIQLEIEDYHEGVVLQRGISNILGYTVVSYEELNGGPYMDISIENSEFIIRTNEAYRLYEENETHDEIHLTFTFQCTGGTNSLPLNVRIAVNDNNNNDPLFKTATTAASRDTTYEFTIVPPVPPGFLITDCVSDIIVRDIDLTNYKIDFEIEENPYVAIAYDETSSTEAKEYKATLRTTSLIRSLPEPIVLTISATDVDQTGDPPITTYTNVTIYGSSEFELPAEPVFSQAYYTANYDDNNIVSLEQSISLQQGYDGQVTFNLEGGYANNFVLVDNNNQVSLSVVNPLPSAALREGQVLLVANAIRADTSGASATIIVQLPEAVNLEFELPHYEGQIVDNTLQLTQLTLSQGYQDPNITATVEDYPSFFTASVVGNVISLTMTPLDAAIIEENNFINLRVTAYSEYSSATTIVTLEVVKEDTVTPVFGKPLYAGTYDSSAGLTLETLILGQGYDNTVQITFTGEHADYFELDRAGASSTLRVVGTGLPTNILSERSILLSIAASKPRTVGATAVVSIALPEARELQFEAPSYSGSLQDNVLTLETIVLNVGYNEDVIFFLVGDYASSFSTSVVQNQVTINVLQQLPQEVILEHNFITLTVVAAGVNALSTTTAVVLEIIKDDVTTPVFSQSIYYGNYLGPANIEIGNINLVQGYDASVSFRIEGENSEYFEFFFDPENNVTLNIHSSIPEEVIFNEKVFVFNIVADKPFTVGANAAISIKFPTELTEPTLMQFSNNIYSGSVEDNVLSVENFILDTGFAEGTEFILTGEYATYFDITATNNVVSLSLLSTLPSEAFENKKFLLLELEARRERAVSVSASVIIDLVVEEITIPVFNQAFYTGVYTTDNTLQFQDTMTLLQGYDQTVEFGLEGELSTWFTLVQNNNSVYLVSITNVPQEVLDRYHQLLFTVVANKPNSIRGEAAISIDLPKDVLEQEVLRFAQSSYEGQINGSDLEVPTIILINEFTENIQFELTGAHAAYFSVSHESNTVYIELTNNIPPEVLSDNEFLVLDITASKLDAISGYTTLVLSIVKEPHVITPVFEQAYYTGEYSNQSGFVFEQTIRLAQGFDETVTFTLQGGGNEWFTLTQNGNSLLLSVVEGGIQEVENVNNLIFSISANKPESVSGQATIVIHLTDTSTETDVEFDKVLYEGTISLSEVQHEVITVTGFTGDTVDVVGDYGHIFSASVSEGAVVVVAAVSFGLPDEVNYVPLELRANGASAVLLLDVLQSETPVLPSVNFGSPSYVLRAEMSQTGVIGQVGAAASNGERITYSLAVNDAHLLERVSVNDAGEIRLSAPTNTGIYSFQAIATSTITAVQATAEIQLTVDASATCGDDEHVLPPLIILDRDEEEPHEKLVVLDNTTQSGCQLSLTNRWPLDQDWLYVDEYGLHARSIDREDPRIAFMALSQVQVELVLECDSDTSTRAKRSASTNSRLDWLGPYEYGSNQWILTDTILYNSRRSFVNLIVNDINDNYPIFVGKENEPIVVGYPIPELEEIVIPRALAELKATDADVGENAALVYWSDEGALAVAPRTGSVHVRDGVSLADGALLTVSATDRNGQDGLTGSIQLLVKLIDSRHIAVVTVRNAFLDHEGTILSNLTAAVGYEVKVLSSAVISDDTDADSANARNKREVSSAEGATLQLYVYGVIDLEPVAVDQLSTDITENVLTGVDIASTVSLEDHLEGREIPGSAGRDTGLLVATIVLSVLLFILIVAIAVWFFLRWRNARNYEEFSDANSVASRNEPLEEPPKAENMKKPRLNIEELKRSERRLQEMLEAPVDVTAKPSSSAVDPEAVFDTIINMAPPDTTMPIVIQSIDKLKDDANSGDEDEYGERKNKNRRKSVVTFNENVEKIIHVEDIPDDSSDFEVFRF